MTRILLALTISFLLVDAAFARTWKIAGGKYKINGDLIAFNDKQVVIKKDNKDKELISVNVDQLSEEDKAFLQSKESEEYLKTEAERVHTWTFQRGFKATARVVDYIQKDITVGKRRGKLYVNDRAFKSLPEVYKLIVQRVIAHYERITVESEKDIEEWLKSRKGKDATFAADGVVLELENGDEYAVPLFLFSDEDQAILKPGYDNWLQSKDDEEKKAAERFLLEAQARAYQQTRQQTRIQQLQLGLLAAESGLVWEVCLVPRPGSIGYPQCVVVPAANSTQATAQALIKYPGYTVGAVRRVN